MHWVWWHDTLININNNDDHIKILTLILKWCCYSNNAIGPKLWFAVILSHCSKTSYMNNKTDIQGKKLAIHSIKFEFIFWIQNKHLNNFSLSKWVYDINAEYSSVSTNSIYISPFNCNCQPATDSNQKLFNVHIQFILYKSVIKVASVPCCVLFKINVIEYTLRNNLSGMLWPRMSEENLRDIERKINSINFLYSRP